MRRAVVHVRRCERGSTVAEYVGVVAVVGCLFAGLVMLHPVQAGRRAPVRPIPAIIRLLQAPALPFRVGHGFDLHRLAPGPKLIIGGIDIPHEKGCVAHSDGATPTTIGLLPLYCKFVQCQHA